MKRTLWLLASGIWLLAGCENDLTTEPPIKPSTGYIVANTSNEVTKEVIQDADIFIDGVKKGFSGVAVKVDTGTHGVYASKGGFENSSTKTVYVSGNDTANVNLTLLPLLGEVFIASEPQGAEIFLNDSETNKKTPTTLNLPGTRDGLQYRISLVFDGYARFDTAVVVKAGLRTEVRATLRKLVGSLYVNSAPQGAEIHMSVISREPRPSGKVTPFEFVDLAPDKYIVLLKHPEREVFTDTVEVKAFETTSIEAELTRCRTLWVGTSKHLLKRPSPSSTCDFPFDSIKGIPPTGGIAVSGDTLVVYTSEISGGLGISYDNAQSWNFVTTCPIDVYDPDQFSRIVSIEIDSENPLEGYLALGGKYEGGPDVFFRFSASGCTSIQNRLPDFRANHIDAASISEIIVHPQNQNEAWFVGTSAIWHTTNRGQTIEIQYRNENVMFDDILIDPFDQNTLYAGGSQCDESKNCWPLILKSINRGNSWQTLATTPQRGWLLSLEANPKQQGHLFMGLAGWLETDIAGGLWESVDGGNSWHSLTPNNWGIYDMVIDHPFVITTHRFAQIGVNQWRDLWNGNGNNIGFGYAIRLQK